MPHTLSPAQLQTILITLVVETTMWLCGDHRERVSSWICLSTKL